MPLSRARWLLPCAAAIVAGCAGNTLSADAPPGVSLAGSWKLNRSASDDPQKVLGQMRAEALRSVPRPPPSGSAPGARTGGSHRTAQDATLPDADSIAPPPGSGGARGDPLLHSPMAHVLHERLAWGDFLTVRQAPGEFALDYGGTQRSFTPGARSVVSAEGGVADQTSGWRGKEYVIRVRGQLGPDVTERFALSADGKHLVEKMHIGPAELPAVELTRVYDPTNENAPHQLPISD